MNLKKNIIGQVYTPDYMADFMVQNIKNQYLTIHDNLDHVEVLEPCAGEGIFLRTLLHRGFKNITAYELDPNLIKSLSEHFPNIKFNFSNFLGSDPYEKYDIIIGNPPYLGQNYNADLFHELVMEFPICRKYFVGNMDLFYYFIHLGILKLKPGGLLSYITTNYWLTKSNKTGIKSLKPHIANDCYILQYIDLSQLKIFKDALGQENCIFILQKKNMQEKENYIDRSIQVIQVKKTIEPLALYNQYCKSIFSNILKNYPTNSFIQYTSAITNNGLGKYDNWNLLYPREVEEIITQIENYCKKNEKITFLGDFFTIRNGLILIKDDIFILKENRQILIEKNDILIKINNQFIRLNSLEKKRLKKIYKSRSIIPYGYLSYELEGYVIYFNKFEFKELENRDTESQISRIYPNLTKYLKQFEKELTEILKNANENPKNIYYPRRGSHIKQEKGRVLIDLEPLYDKSPKIFFKFISQENIFGYTKDQYYATSDTYFLWPKKPAEFSCLFLIAYLNSNVVRFISKSRGLSMKRSKTNIEKRIPIPIFSEFKSKDKDSIIELIEILAKLLVILTNRNDAHDVQDILDELEFSSYINSPGNNFFKEKNEKSTDIISKGDIKSLVDNLFCKLFDLDGKRLDYLMREYYHD